VWGRSTAVGPWALPNFIYLALPAGFSAVNLMPF